MPIFLLEMIRGYPTDDALIEEIDTDQFYSFFMFMKIFRLLKAGAIKRSLEFILNKVSEIFIRKNQMLTQLLSLIMTGVSFVLSMHFFTCGWILMEYRHDGIIFDANNSEIVNYVSAAYFMTTTISTVGYGDISAKMNNEEIWAVEMVYMSLVTVAGILLFSSVTNEIFTYRYIETW